MWADSHPYWEAIVKMLRKEIIADQLKDRWISVKDELPPRFELNPNVSVSVITYGFLGDSHPVVELNHYHFGDGRWLYSEATHWMPFEHPEKGGEE